MPYVRKIEAIQMKKKTAAYARVSTLMEEQEESFETQRNYYEGLIRKNPDWDFAGVYADRGITGTSAVKRPAFMQMIEAARKGEIDIILCKSISRFSRNALDAQRYVHELKSIHVEVRFEKEAISSYDISADLIFSVLASASEMESRSISENVKWSYRRKMEMGVRHLGCNRLLGYDEVDGRLTPNQDAWIVRMIYEAYADGAAPRDIMKLLDEKGVTGMRTKQPMNWTAIQYMLQNEAYTGDRKLQKKPPTDVMTKKPVPNCSYVSYYVYDDHEAIVTAALWEAVQERLKRTKDQKDRGLHMRCTNHYLYGKVFCARCGEPFCRFTARDTHGLYKTWRCRGRAAGTCHSPQIRETVLIDHIERQLRMEGWTAGVREWALRESSDRVLVEENCVVLEKNGGGTPGEQ